jgi:hypothetical protein
VSKPNVRILPTDLMLYLLGATEHIGWQELWDEVSENDQAATVERAARLGLTTRDGIHFTTRGEVVVMHLAELLERSDVL